MVTSPLMAVPLKETLGKVRSVFRLLVIPILQIARWLFLLLRSELRCSASAQPTRCYSLVNYGPDCGYKSSQGEATGYYPGADVGDCKSCHTLPREDLPRAFPKTPSHLSAINPNH